MFLAGSIFNHPEFVRDAAAPTTNEAEEGVVAAAAAAKTTLRNRVVAKSGKTRVADNDDAYVISSTVLFPIDIFALYTSALTRATNVTVHTFTVYQSYLFYCVTFLHFFCFLLFASKKMIWCDYLFNDDD